MSQREGRFLIHLELLEANTNHSIWAEHYTAMWTICSAGSSHFTNILTDESGKSGVYYDERGRPMLGSALVRDSKFRDRVVSETRAFLAANAM